MTKEEKDLVFKDLCARLLYKPKVHVEHDVFYDEREPYDTELNLSVLYNRCGGMEIKPYLRPMSSMTDEEEKEVEKMWGWHYDRQANAIFNEDINNPDDYGGYHLFSVCEGDAEQLIDWLNEHHFDYRGLIDKGLAIEIKNN